MENNQSNNDNVMRFEERRLCTFQNWPSNAKVEPKKIARAGFYATGRACEVKCGWCNATLDRWEYGDQVMSRHRSANPDCPFIKNESNNVPLLSLTGSNSQSTANSEAFRAARNNPNGPAINSTNSEDVIMNENDETEESLDNSDEDIVGDSSFETSSSRQSQSTTMNSNSLLRSVSSHQEEERQPHFSFDNQETHRRLKRESARLETFVNWPLRTITPEDLARSGFVYTGSADCVRCVFCGEYVGQWEPTDIPEVEHRNLFPHCPFVSGDEVGNIRITDTVVSLSTSSSSYDITPNDVSRNSRIGVARTSESTSQTPTPGGASQDEAGPRSERPLRYSRELNSGAEKGGSALRWASSSQRQRTDSQEEQDPANLEAAGIIRHSGPAHPKYSTIESRMRTFRDWPPALKQRPKDLAEAGFYYIGLSDQAKCFYCDGGLRNWNVEDEPWTEHARWFSKCGFVRLVKGDEFIQQVLKDKPPESFGEASEVNSSKDRLAAQMQQCEISGTVDEAEIQRQMSSPVVAQVLGLGIDPSRIKAAIRRRMSSRNKTPFRNPDELTDAVFNVQREQEFRYDVENGIEEEANSRSETAFMSTSSLPSVVSGAMRAEEEEASGASASASTQQAPEDVVGEAPRRTEDESLGQNDESLRSSQSAPNVTAVKSHPTVKTETTKEKKEISSHPVEANSLEEENQRLRDEKLCKVCMDHQVGVVFVPCGHLICCVRCAPALANCPLCRKTIQATVKTYMS